jgi:hypothetical protein
MQFLIADSIMHLVVSPLYLLPSWNLSSVGLFSILRAVFDSELTGLARISIDENITAWLALIDSRAGLIKASALIFGLKIVVACQIQRY